MRVYGSLRRRSEFSRLQRRGKRRVGSLLVLLALPARDRTRVGITIAKTTGNAVIRNRLRRRLKAILDAHGLDRTPPRDLLFIARPGAGEARFDALLADVRQLVGGSSA